MDFNKYKNNLLDYLKSKGIKAHRGLVRCFNPQHNDKNPSCELFRDHFVCYACGIHGDIYDAVGILEGITNKKEQYLFLENFFGGNTSVSQVVYTPIPEKKPFQSDPIAVAKLDNYLFKNPSAPEMTKLFLATRCQKTTNGKIKQYPDEIVKKLSTVFGWWPGLSEILHSFTKQELFSAGIPVKIDNQGYSAWAHSGIVFKIGEGYKLHYYNGDKCEKRGSLRCSTFPTPCKKLPEEIILVEGEMDAFVCQAAGMTNVFATGGINGLTGPKIKKYLLSSVKKITILFDNDEPGHAAAGIIKKEHQTSIPEKLEKAGFKGDIFIAKLDKYKDPDEAICNNEMICVKNAVLEKKHWASYTSSTSEDCATGPQIIKSSNMSTKVLKAFLREIKKTEISKTEFNNTLSALQLSVKNYQETIPVFQSEGVSQHRLEHRNEIKTSPNYLIYIANKYLSYYWQNKIKILINNDKKKEKTTEINIDFSSVLNNPNLDNFILLHGEMSAALIVAEVLKNKLIYVENENKFYLYNGHIWGRCSNVPEIVYDICSEIIKRYCTENESFLTSPAGTNKLKSINFTKKTIEQRKWRTAVSKELSEIEGIFHETIDFDGSQIQETLTLEDGVLDFSGKEIKIRESKPEEYRLRILPYKIDDVIESGSPTKFLKFMKGNFKNIDTLKTLFYYLSLIPSRCAQYKVGGIFIGTGGTGKTTTMKIISDLYPNMTTPIPREVIMLNKDIRTFGGGANPAIAELKGMGAGISDETQRNDMLNSAVFKQLTGGGKMKARKLYSNPEEFKPTAQTIILTNYLPRFDNKDPATIDRMVVIPFSVEHKRGEGDFKDENDIFELLRPEYPAIIKFFANLYIELKTLYKGKIPLSKECLDYKEDYVEDQATDLDRFVKENIEFVKEEGVFTKVKDVYARYCQVNNIELNEKGQPIDKDVWTQNKLTHFLKSDYTEIHIKQKRFNGGNPEQIIINMRLKENKNLEAKPPRVQPELPTPEDNPWD